MCRLLEKTNPSGAYEDIDYADCFFIIGANPYECHPPIWERIMIRKKNNPNVKIVVVDPRRTESAKRADYHLSVIPGTDLLLLNAMAHIIVNQKLTDPNFIKNHITFHTGKEKVTFTDYVKFLDDYAPEKVYEELGLTINQIVEITHLFAKSNSTMSLWTMGINQRTQGVFLNNCLSSLHLITGQICKAGATPLSLTGQSNACGGVRDTGSLSHILPGGRFVKNKKGS
jgi:nitrate reductase NapA